jgi:hypothetical protein
MCPVAGLQLSGAPGLAPCEPPALPLTPCRWTPAPSSQIIGLHKLRTKYESHEAKRQLCGSYDLFLADERVVPSLPKLIGKSFFRKRKQPVPVNIMSPNFPEQVGARGGGRARVQGAACARRRAATRHAPRALDRSPQAAPPGPGLTLVPGRVLHRRSRQRWRPPT